MNTSCIYGKSQQGISLFLIFQTLFKREGEMLGKLADDLNKSFPLLPRNFRRRRIQFLSPTKLRYSTDRRIIIVP